MKELMGEQFLNKLYKNLYMTNIVKHSSNYFDTPIKRIKKYMDRLEKIQNRVNSDYRERIIKRLYYDKYVIKREMLGNYNEKDQDLIIKRQEETLDSWLDYLIFNKSKYPMWVKYWAFQGMLKIGNYDANNDIYDLRSKKTISPFIEIDTGVLDKCMNLLMMYVDNKSIYDKDIEELLCNGNFRKLYTKLVLDTKKKNNSISGITGKWIKYNQGSLEDAKKLYDSLKGYNTGWCTVSSLSEAISQLCGGERYIGGDFYVYYTKNQNDEYKIPRIAIRMSGKEHISEIVGVTGVQNLEEGLEDILLDKINEMSFIDLESKNKYILCIQNNKRLTELNKKLNNKDEITKEDYLFIYQDYIDTLGMDYDPRIEKIKNKLVVDDYELGLEILRQNCFSLRYFSSKLQYNQEFLLEAIRYNVSVMLYIKIEILNDYDFMLKAIEINAMAIRYASKYLKNDLSFMKRANKIIKKQNRISIKKRIMNKI